MAAYKGHEACVQALLRAKADTELSDDYGRTALQWAEAEGHSATAQLIRQHAAPPQPTAAEQAAQAARADAAMEELLDEEETKQAKAQVPTKKSKKKKKKADCTAAAGDEPSEALPAAAPAPDSYTHPTPPTPHPP